MWTEMDLHKTLSIFFLHLYGPSTLDRLRLALMDDNSQSHGAFDGATTVLACYSKSYIHALRVSCNCNEISRYSMRRVTQATRKTSIDQKSRPIRYVYFPWIIAHTHISVAITSSCALHLVQVILYSTGSWRCQNHAGHQPSTTVTMRNCQGSW